MDFNFRLFKGVYLVVYGLQIFIVRGAVEFSAGDFRDFFKRSFVYLAYAMACNLRIAEFVAYNSAVFVRRRVGYASAFACGNDVNFGVEARGGFGGGYGGYFARVVVAVGKEDYDAAFGVF